MLDRVGLTAAADARVKTYSLGMKQRLALATALLGSPELLILDEPTNGLDPAGVRDLVRQYAAAGGTVLVPSHQLAEIAQVVDRAVVIHEGRHVGSGPIGELTAGHDSLEDAFFAAAARRRGRVQQDCSVLAMPADHEFTSGQPPDHVEQWCNVVITARRRSRRHEMSGRMHRGWGGPARGGRGPGRGGWQQADLPDADESAAWLRGRLPDGWFVGAPEVTVDREEIVIVGQLPGVEGAADTEAGRADRAAAVAGRISRFRETTREERVEIARQAENRYGRKVAWGARIGEDVELFTVASVPVMTRLRQPERIVLDTLVDSGVARSRSDALAWAVRLVGEHADEWLGELREAMAKVDDLRAKGPTGDAPADEE